MKSISYVRFRDGLLAPSLGAVLLGTAFFAAGCSRSTAPGPGVGEPLEERYPEIPRRMEQAGVTGLALAVLAGGEVAWQGVLGVSDQATGAPMTLDSVFEGASLSKPVFAYLLMRLVERGEIDLDRPVAEVFSEPRLSADPRHLAITPRMLLAHRSGLPNWGGTPLRLSQAPDNCWSYSGEGYMLLTRLVEEVSGMDLDALARREVFEPLGMNSTGFRWRDDYEETAAVGHDMLGRHLEPRRRAVPNAAGSLQTTVGDFARFLRAVHGAEGLPERSIEEMLTSHGPAMHKGTATPSEVVHWGLGWGIERLGEGRRVFHWGANAGYQCGFVLDPSSGDGFVFFTNSDNGFSVARDLVDWILPGPSPALEWSAFETWDDPRRQARIFVQRAFVHQDLESGLEAYGQLLNRNPALVDEAQVRAVAAYLRSADREIEARALLREFEDGARGSGEGPG